MVSIGVVGLGVGAVGFACAAVETRLLRRAGRTIRDLRHERDELVARQRRVELAAALLRTVISARCGVEATR